MISLNLLILTVLIFILNCTSQALNAIRYVSHKNCNHVKKGTIVTNPGNCSQYIICNGLRSTLGECPDGQYFNGEILSCDKNPIQCQQKSTTTNTTVSTTKTPVTATIATTTSAPPPLVMTESEPLTTITPLRPICSTLHMEHNVAHPQNCVLYYQCARGVLSLKRCPFGHGWDWKKHRCIPLAKAVCYKS